VSTVLAQRLGADPEADNAPQSLFFVKRGRAASLSLLNERLSANTWLAGEEFTAADVMTVWCCTTMRLFTPYSLEGYEGILAWLQRVGKREAYRRAMGKGDPGLEPLLGAGKPDFLKL
jgi:glutathione S-transferase